VGETEELGQELDAVNPLSRASRRHVQVSVGERQSRSGIQSIKSSSETRKVSSGDEGFRRVVQKRGGR